MSRSAYVLIFLACALAALVAIAEGAHLISSPFREAQIPADATDATEEGGFSLLDALGLLVIPLVLFVGYRIYELYKLTDRNSQLVVTDLGNSSGVADLSGSMPGLSQLFRERLIREMKDVRERVRRTNRGTLASALKDGPLPSGLENRRLTELIAAVADAVPEQLKPVVQLVNLLVPPRGTKVNANLQRRGDLPGTAGISFELVDIEGKRDPEIHALWEEPLPPSDSAGSNGRSVSGQGDDAAPRAGDRGSSGTATDPDADARAIYEVGSLYEERGALEQAKGRYEAALEKRAGFAPAREALNRVLGAEGRTPSERYHALLGPAARWLAVELTKRTMLDDVSRWAPATRADASAMVYNFAGAYYLDGASGRSGAYEQAEKNFLRAAEHAPDWHLPYENLAVARSYAGRQFAALRAYEDALRRTEAANDMEAQCRIRIGKAISQLRSGDEDAMEEARGSIAGIASDCTRALPSNPRVLYNLACWHATEARVSEAQDPAAASAARRRAREYLRDALANDAEGLLGEWAPRDPDLDGIRGTS